MFSNSVLEYWGEIPRPHGGAHLANWDKVVPKELGKLVILSAIKPELPKPYQPAPDESCNNIIPVPIECQTMDSKIMNTIKLIQYSRKVTELINIANSEEEENIAEKIKNCPPFPELTQEESKVNNNIDQDVKCKVFQEDELSPFAAGKPVDHFKLNSSVSLKILKKCVCCILAHQGFDNASTSALNVFTDVVHDFMQRITKHLHHVVNQEILHGPSLFPDAIEQIYFKMGLGSIRNLQEYYQHHVIDSVEKARNEALQRMGEYQVCCALLQVKDAPYDLGYKKEDDDIPELHLPNTGEDDGLDELQPSLKPEFQMLDMLEQEVHSMP